MSHAWVVSDRMFVNNLLNSLLNQFAAECATAVCKLVQINAFA